VTAGLKAHPRDEPGPLGRSLGDGPQPGALLEEDERLVAELSQEADRLHASRG
jgi:hypothetical protein